MFKVTKELNGVIVNDAIARIERLYYDSRGATICLVKYYANQDMLDACSPFYEESLPVDNRIDVEHNPIETAYASLKSTTQFSAALDYH